jgi:hypothetical protein
LEDRAFARLSLRHGIEKLRLAKSTLLAAVRLDVLPFY